MKRLFSFALIIICFNPVIAQTISPKPEIGIAQSIDNDSLLNASGFTCLVESVQKLFSPTKVSDQQFQQNLKTLHSLKVPVFAINIFIPSELMLVGPGVKEDSVLKYAEQVFKRTQAAGIKMIIWGSGGSRRIPDGFDVEKATGQFISIARKTSILAQKYDIVLALENLNSTETNFINTVREAYEIAQKVNHPNFRVCADIYHMLKEGESAAIIPEAKKYLVHCDIAEKENRTPPGTNGDDFRPYLRALKKIDYKGKIIMECRWEDLSRQAPQAYLYLQKEIDEVYSK